MNQKIGVGVVGLGPRGLSFVQLYDQDCNSKFKLVSVCDVNERQLAIVRKHYGENISYHTNVHAMLADDRVEALIVATGDPYHVEPTLAGLQAGRHVLVEKPLCQSVEEAQQILRAAATAKGILMIGFELRNCTVFVRMKQLIDEGRIGQVRIGHCFDNVCVGGDYYYHDPGRQKAFYKTLLLQKASHSLDLLNWFMGSDPVKVYGLGGQDFFGRMESPELKCADCTRSDSCPYQMKSDRFTLDYGFSMASPGCCVWSQAMDLNDNSELCISYANGGKATFHECHFTPEYSREFWLVGTKGKMYGYFDNPGRFLIRIQYSHRKDGQTEEWRPVAGSGGHGGGDVGLRDEFYRRILEKSKPLDALASAYYSTALAVCAEESIDSGLPVTIPPVSLLDTGTVTTRADGQV